MGSPFLSVFIPIVAIIIVIFLALGLVSRGKKLKCPECGTVFPAPMVDEKRTVGGFTFPYTGQLTCPKCGAKHSRSDFRKAASS